MSECFDNGICCRPDDLHSALAIHTQKITDSCRDKDCIEDLRVYLTRDSQEVLQNAANVKVRSAELIHATVDVTPVNFHPNRYCVDLTFYYRVLADASVPCKHPVPITGYTFFEKRAVLCGEAASTRIFTSDDGETTRCDPMPKAVAEVLEPMVLASRIGCSCGCDCAKPQCPEAVRHFFDGDFCYDCCEKLLYVTLGQFSVIRLERPAQLIVPVLDYALPTKQCCDNPGCSENPCELFSQIPFPSQEFTPTGCDHPKPEDCDCCKNT